MMSGSSKVPSTIEWLARICSIRVEPERGRPRMKIGAAEATPPSARSARNSRVNSFLEPRVWERMARDIERIEPAVDRGARWHSSANASAHSPAILENFAKA